jgi:hypothetical protein
MCTLNQAVFYLKIVTFTLSYNKFPMESVHANQNKQPNSIWELQKCQNYVSDKPTPNGS